jgi:uncharacterized protein (UPF0297 family)
MSCIYVYKRANDGNKCTDKICKKSTKYCSKHYYIEKNEEKKKLKKKSITKMLNTSQNIVTEIETDVIEDMKGYLILKDTSYIINGLKSKIVIGKLENDDFCSLKDKDIEICKINNWKYKQFI